MSLERYPRKAESYLKQKINPVKKTQKGYACELWNTPALSKKWNICQNANSSEGDSNKLIDWKANDSLSSIERFINTQTE